MREPPLCFHLRDAAPFAVSCTPTLGEEGVIHSIAWPILSPPIAKASPQQILGGTQMLPVFREELRGLFWENLRC